MHFSFTVAAAEADEQPTGIQTPTDEPHHGAGFFGPRVFREGAQSYCLLPRLGIKGCDRIDHSLGVAMKKIAGSHAGAAIRQSKKPLLVRRKMKFHRRPLGRLHRQFFLWPSLLGGNNPEFLTLQFDAPVAARTLRDDAAFILRRAAQSAETNDQRREAREELAPGSLHYSAS